MLAQKQQNKEINNSRLILSKLIKPLFVLIKHKKAAKNCVTVTHVVLTTQYTNGIDNKATDNDLR